MVIDSVRTQCISDDRYLPSRSVPISPRDLPSHSGVRGRAREPVGRQKLAKRRQPPRTRSTAPTPPAGRPPRPDVVHSSVYLHKAVYEALRETAFKERLKIHDVIMQGIDLAVRKRGVSLDQGSSEWQTSWCPRTRAREGVGEAAAKSSRYRGVISIPPPTTTPPRGRATTSSICRTRRRQRLQRQQ